MGRDAVNGYRIVAASGTVLRKGYETAEDARRAQSREANAGALGFATSHIETDDGLIRMLAPTASDATLRAANAANIRRAKRYGNVRAVLGLLTLVAIGLFAAAVIWAGIVFLTAAYDVVAGL